VARRPSAIRNLQDIADDSKGRKNWLVYGDSGAGKTVLAGTAPKALFLTVEAAGTESAQAFGSSADELVVDTWNQFQEYYEWLKNGGCKDYDWVIPDSISELEEICFPQVMAEQRTKNKARSAEVPGMDTYQIVYLRMRRMIDAFNRLPVNVLYTAHAMRLAVDDEDGEESTLLLPLVGSTKNGVLSQKICGKMTLVGYLNVRGADSKTGGDRRLWTASTDRMFAKDRHHTFGRYVENPNIAEMVEAVGNRGTAQPKRKKKKKETV
jgi:phage nucleotide-binding protein